MLIKTTTRRYELQRGNVETSVTESTRSAWKGRSVGSHASRGYTRVPNHVLDHCQDLTQTYKSGLLLIMSHAHNETGAVQMGAGRLAGWMGMSESSADRRIRVYVALGYLERQHDYDEQRRCWGETTYRINLHPRRGPVDAPQEINKPVEVESKIETTPSVTFDGPFNSINNSSSNTESCRDTAPTSGAAVCGISAKPTKTPEQPPHRPRNARHRHGFVLSAFQVAALEVMQLCGVVSSPTTRRLRDGIAAAIALHVERREDRAKHAVEPMVLAWCEYLDAAWRLRCPLGMEAFFVTGIWCNEKSWRYDAAVTDEIRARRRW